jgi:hypothetical protein
MGWRRGLYRVLVENLGDPGLDGRIVLRRTFRKCDINV